ncbi:hypothetical protein E3N88_01804 [Mikania micrantha]|uniref:Uncharacterized protein n=1 Tax=Mikania micrantha TaxID=192012 RepID=A0A5N6Q4B5_9ASTR|nr:hypothetical protein E3N88_01804 [Mikania micrantha]
MYGASGMSGGQDAEIDRPSSSTLPPVVYPAAHRSHGPHPPPPVFEFTTSIAIDRLGLNRHRSWSQSPSIIAIGGAAAIVKGGGIGGIRRWKRGGWEATGRGVWEATTWTILFKALHVPFTSSQRRTPDAWSPPPPPSTDLHRRRPPPISTRRGLLLHRPAPPSSQSPQATTRSPPPPLQQPPVVAPGSFDRGDGDSGGRWWLNGGGGGRWGLRRG